MPDHLTRINDFRLIIWETNKGRTLGLFKWRVQKLVRELNWWVTIDKYRRFATFDEAMRDGNDALTRAMNAQYCPECITVQLERVHRLKFKPEKVRCPVCGYTGYPEATDA